MIQPNELRIGNWVFDDCNDLCQISSLNSGKKAKFEGWDSDFGEEGPLVEYAGKDGIYISESINPIPLTAEWLERCGKKCEPGGHWDYRINVGALNWFFRYNTEWYSEIGLIYIDSRVQYLHQLQNPYFALTGKELAIKTM